MKDAGIPESAELRFEAHTGSKEPNELCYTFFYQDPEAACNLHEGW